MLFDVLAATTVFFGLLGSFCMRVRIGSRIYRAMCRSVCALGALIAFSCIPGLHLGVNLLNVTVLSLLGAPGAVLLQVIAHMP